jgi:hypothetical protein
VFFDRKGVASTRTSDQTSLPSSSSPCCPARITDAAQRRAQRRQRSWTAVALAAAMAAPVAVVGLAQLPAGGAEAKGTGKSAGAKPAVAAEPKPAEISDELKAAYREPAGANNSVGTYLSTLAPAQGAALASAADAPPPVEAAPALTNEQLIQRGMQLLKEGKYEEAAEALGQVKTLSLTPAESRRVSSAMAEATDAANQRRQAREEFDRGEQALQSGRTVEAADHYRSAMNNRFADEGTRRKAQEQLALATAGNGGGAAAQPQQVAAPAAPAQAQAQSGDPRQAYEAGVQYYNNREYTAARQSFEKARAAGYNPGPFKETPEKYLQMIEAREVESARLLATMIAQQQQERQRQAEMDALRQQQQQAQAQPQQPAPVVTEVAPQPQRRAASRSRACASVSTARKRTSARLIACSTRRSATISTRRPPASCCPRSARSFRSNRARHRTSSSCASTNSAPGRMFAPTSPRACVRRRWMVSRCPISA